MELILSIPRFVTGSKQECIVLGHASHLNSVRVSFTSIERPGMYQVPARVLRNFYQVRYGTLMTVTVEIVEKRVPFISNDSDRDL